MRWKTNPLYAFKYIIILLTFTFIVQFLIFIYVVTYFKDIPFSDNQYFPLFQKDILIEQQIIETGYFKDIMYNGSKIVGFIVSPSIYNDEQNKQIELSDFENLQYFTLITSVDGQIVQISNIVNYLNKNIPITLVYRKDIWGNYIKVEGVTLDISNQ